MAIRDSQDVTLVGSKNSGKPRVSQDVALVPSTNHGNPRVSQDVILVLSRPYRHGPITSSQAQQSQDANGTVSGTIVSSTQASQTQSATGRVAIAVRDSQDVSVVLATNVGHPRDSQDLTLALARNAGAPRLSQDVVLALMRRLVAITSAQASQTQDATGSTAPHTKPARPDRQLHPVIKPLDFLSRPLTQAGKRSAAFTTVLTAAGASRAFSMPMGGKNLPVAGRVFSFTMGGSLALGSVGGTLIITPFYGASADGVNLGQSAAHTYAANYATVTQWRLKGEILFQRVDLTPGVSLVVCSGAFVMGGDPKIPGSGVTILFGSASPITVDTGSVLPSASGALNFAATFSPLSMNAVRPSISAKYAFLRS